MCFKGCFWRTYFNSSAVYDSSFKCYTSSLSLLLDDLWEESAHYLFPKNDAKVSEAMKS